MLDSIPANVSAIFVRPHQRLLVPMQRNGSGKSTISAFSSFHLTLDGAGCLLSTSSHHPWDKSYCILLLEQDADAVVWELIRSSSRSHSEDNFNSRDNTPTHKMQSCDAF
ncbi:hypothetical protein NPIL_346931 [Nephila pilipes]|uniref:Uncharacterized protein n=1 Tax=Nephila pilipes TaxID=299642 RepID=A0A8X6U8K6_NEPPI|nr:hypothetical protein NPIL_346931 [Nephila pilipes]